MTTHPYEYEDQQAWFSRADRFDGFDRGDLDNSYEDELAALNQAWEDQQSESAQK